MITFSDDTPVWIKDWVLYSHSLLIPEWELEVEMKDCVDEDVPECTGEVNIENGYLRATVYYQSDLQHTAQNITRVVVHEICHIFLGRMVSAAENLISNSVVKKTCWKNYEEAEETAIVQLSRVLVKLRNEIDNKTKC
jgi:hypothetical protein